MRILVVGASGTLGRAVVAELGARHEIVSAGSRSGDVRMDLGDAQSIVAALGEAGELDAVVSAAGNVTFAPLESIEAAAIESSAFGLGLRHKVLGQINLALAARAHLRHGGSITLTTGVLVDQPIVSGVPASVANGAIEAFVRAAAIELPRGLRINAVSPTVLVESMPTYGPFFRGFEAVPAARAALAFSRSVEGAQTGCIYRVL